MHRHSRNSLVLTGALGLLAVTAAARPEVPLRSDPIGCYAVIDKVIIDDGGGENDPTIQIFGVFALSDGAQSYWAAERGYLYFTMNRNEKATRAEWNDLKSMAGTGIVVGFGGRYDNLGRIHNVAEPMSRPVAYSNGWNGVIKNTRITGWAYDQVRSIPEPVSPAPNARVAPGSVTFVAKPAADKNLAVVIEIIGPDGIAERTDPMIEKRPAAQYSWTPKMQLKAGARYNWRVYTPGNPPATSTIYVNPAK